MTKLRRLFCGLSLILALALAIGAFETGCTTPAQRTAFATIGSVDTAAKAAFSSYISLVNDHIVGTNDLPKVATLYKQVENGCKVAEALAENGTNSLAPALLTDELNKLTTFVSSVIPK